MISIRKQRRTHSTFIAGLVFVILTLVISLPAGGVSAAELTQATAPPLGNAESFAVLAALSATSANTTNIWGDGGLSPGLATSWTGPWVVGGGTYFGTGGESQDAQADALVAFNNLAGQTSDGSWGDISPAPGVWTAADSPTFTGTLTLTGDYDDVWVFQISTDFTFSGNVVMAGDAQACNVFWQISRDATIASGSQFVGTLIASGDISVVSGASVIGRIISLNSSITVDANTISYPPCAVAPTPTSTTAPDTEPAATAAPEILPDTGGDMDETQTAGTSYLQIGLGILGVGLVVFGFLLVRKKQPQEN